MINTFLSPSLGKLQGHRSLSVSLPEGMEGRLTSFHLVYLSCSRAVRRRGGSCVRCSLRVVRGTETPLRPCETSSSRLGWKVKVGRRETSLRANESSLPSNTKILPRGTRKARMGLATIVEYEKWIPERYREGQGRGVTSVQGKMIDHDGTVHRVESLKMISRGAEQSLVYDGEPKAIYDVKKYNRAGTRGRRKFLPLRRRTREISRVRLSSLRRFFAAAIVVLAHVVIVWQPLTDRDDPTSEEPARGNVVRRHLRQEVDIRVVARSRRRRRERRTRTGRRRLLQVSAGGGRRRRQRRRDRRRVLRRRVRWRVRHGRVRDRARAVEVQLRPVVVPTAERVAPRGVRRERVRQGRRRRLVLVKVRVSFVVVDVRGRPSARHLSRTAVRGEMVAHVGPRTRARERRKRSQRFREVQVEETARRV